MSTHLTRRFLLAALGSVATTGVVLAEAPLVSIHPQPRLGRLRKTALGGPEKLVAQAGLSGDTAFVVADVKSGLRLEGFNDTKGQPPASVAKAVTTLYALDVLGPEHRFQTRLMATGPVSNGILEGNLYLVGGGDPTLNTDDLAGLAKALKSAGVREVRGGFRVYDGALPYVHSIDPGQPDPVGYSPAVTGIALNFNRVHFEWKRNGSGYGVTMDARTERVRPAVQMARMKIAARAAPVYTYEERGGIETWTVAKAALGKGGARWLPVRRPAEYAGDVFRTLARSHCIDLKAAKTTRSLPSGTVLAQHNSEPLRVILKNMLKYSNNLTAEMVGLAATVKRGQTPGSLKASGREMSAWAGQKLGMKQTLLVDHSGLGGASRMTPSDLVGALVLVHKRGILRPLLKPFTLKDAKGRPVKGHPVKVQAKTGTLNFVSGLGGFMTAADGTELAFAIFSADEKIRARIKKSDRERPDGARSWSRRSRKLQQQLIERWGQLYGS